MKRAEWISKLNRAQHDVLFKWIASVVVLGVMIAGLATYTVISVRAASDEREAREQQVQALEAEIEDEQERQELQSRQKQFDEMLGNVLSARMDLRTVATGALIGTGVALVVVWLGLALTYFAVLIGVGVLVYPLTLWEVTTPYAVILGGAAALTLSFTALMQGVRAGLSGTGPVQSVARNVLAEATRMRLSVVFIILLIFGMATLPGLLDAGEELRYRVQSFLQYGTGGSFWIIALLTLLFGAATVSFEQRDRLIWQTMTKPVTAWQYILGKWIGVVTLSAILLGVCGTGVFLFTEYLRNQQAVGEVAPFEAAQGLISEDRLILNNQVLTARVSIQPEPPVARDDEIFRERVQHYVETQRRQNPDFARSDEEREEVIHSLYETYVQEFYSIRPGGARVFRFTGMQAARQTGRPFQLNYRIDSGENRPDEFYRLVFEMNSDDGPDFRVRETGLGYTHVIPDVSPQAVDPRDGTFVVRIINDGLTDAPDFSQTVHMPRGTLEVSFAAGSFQMNFLRVLFVLWVKLAFLAMVAITAATFLSFPVACVVAVATFLAAEGAGYLSESVQYFAVTDDDGNRVFYKVVVAGVTFAVSWIFQTYADLQPTTRLVDGRLLSWLSVLQGTLVLAVSTGLLYVISVVIFRRRELATYSGQ